MNSLDGAFLLIILVVLLIALIPYCIYLKNLQDLLEEISTENRQVPSSNVWLMLIPLFNYVYGFILYPKITDSIRNEMEARGASESGDYSRGIGLSLPILRVSGIVPVIGGLAGLGWIVMWIIFWVKTAEYKSRLRSLPKDGGVRLSGRADLLD